MYEVMSDASGGIHFFPLEEDDYRNSRSRPRPRRPRPRSQNFRPAPRPRNPVEFQEAPPQPYQPMPYQMPHAPMPYPPMPYPGYPVPYGQGPAALDMRTGLRAIGAILPGLGQLLSAFRRPPDRPQISGDPQKDIARLVDYIGDTFDRDRTGAQTAGVLATTGAVMEILASL